MLSVAAVTLRLGTQPLLLSRATNWSFQRWGSCIGARSRPYRAKRPGLEEVSDRTRGSHPA